MTAEPLTDGVLQLEGHVLVPVWLCHTDTDDAGLVGSHLTDLLLAEAWRVKRGWRSLCPLPLVALWTASRPTIVPRRVMKDSPTRVDALAGAAAGLAAGLVVALLEGPQGMVAPALIGLTPGTIALGRTCSSRLWSAPSSGTGAGHTPPPSLAA